MWWAPAAVVLAAAAARPGRKPPEGEPGMPEPPEGATSGPWRGALPDGEPDMNVLQEDEAEIKRVIQGDPSSMLPQRSFLFVRLRDDAPANITAVIESMGGGADPLLEAFEWGINHSPAEGLGLGRPTHVMSFSFRSKSQRARWAKSDAVLKAREELLGHTQSLLHCDSSPKAAGGLPPDWGPLTQPLPVRHVEALSFTAGAPTEALLKEYAAAVEAAAAAGVAVRAAELGGGGLQAEAEAQSRAGSLSHCVTLTFGSRPARDAWLQSAARAALRQKLAERVARSVVADYDASPVAAAAQLVPSLPLCRRLLLLAAKAGPSASGDAAAKGFAQVAASAQPHTTAVQWGRAAQQPHADALGMHGRRLTHGVVVTFSDGRQGRDGYLRHSAMLGFQQLSEWVEDAAVIDYDAVQLSGDGGAAQRKRLVLLRDAIPSAAEAAAARAAATAAELPGVAAVEWGWAATPQNTDGGTAAVLLVSLQDADAAQAEAEAAAEDGWRALLSKAAGGFGSVHVLDFRAAPVAVAEDDFRTAPTAADGGPDTARLKEWRVRQLGGYLRSVGGDAGEGLDKAALMHRVRKAAEQRRASEQRVCADGTVGGECMPDD